MHQSCSEDVDHVPEEPFQRQRDHCKHFAVSLVVLWAVFAGVTVV